VSFRDDRARGAPVKQKSVSLSQGISERHQSDYRNKAKIGRYERSTQDNMHGTRKTYKNNHRTEESSVQWQLDGPASHRGTPSLAEHSTP